MEFVNTFWALVPPIVAIVLALITKETYSSLFIGILVGALLATGFNPIGTVDTMINEGFVPAISGNAGKKVLIQLFETDDSVDAIVEKLGLKQVSDEGAIQKLVDEVLAANPKSVEDYKGGKKNVVGFLVGQCMKASKGKGNPKMINQCLNKTLAKL